MRYLFKDWDNIKQGLQNKFIILFLDYDGTLSPIAKKPEEARLPQKTKASLVKLSNMPHSKLAIISGRAVNDIKKLVGLNGAIYAGNHGLEIEGPKIKFVTPLSARYKKAISRLKNELTAKLSGTKGVLLEDKGLALSIHYRLVPEREIPRVKTVLHEATILHRIRDEIRIREGKMVFEICPSMNWDKGRVVLWLLARERFGSKGRGVLPIYIGDDLTDESAFLALRNIGITIFVGRPKGSAAKYYLRDTQDVARFLSLVSKLIQTH